jgi:4'-phosphopantetheinyl transferase
LDLRLEQDALLLHWSAKETVYKILDIPGTDFRKHLFVRPFSVAEEGVIETEEFVTGHNYLYVLSYRISDDYVLTWYMGVK